MVEMPTSLSAVAWIVVAILVAMCVVATPWVCYVLARDVWRRLIWVSPPWVVDRGVANREGFRVLWLPCGVRLVWLPREWVGL